MLTIEEIEQVENEEVAEAIPDAPTDELEPSATEQEQEQEPRSEDDPPKIDPIKSLRDANKKKLKKLKEQERKIQELESKLNEPKTSGELKKPSMRDEDIDFDVEKYEERMESYILKKKELDSRASSVNDEWTKTLDLYEKGKRLLEDDDFEEYEAEVKNSLNALQQTVILQASRNPALVVRELGKDPNRLQQLETIQDPIKLAVAVASLENGIKKASKEGVPEKRVTSGGSNIGSEKAIIDRMLSKSSTDTSDLAAYFRNKRNSTR